MKDKERNERWTNQALSHKDGMGRPIEGVTTKELPSLSKDANGQVIIPDNVSEERLTVVKSVHTRVNLVSPFANSPVKNAFTDF